jgi:CelD/BcsL family acetyltransferase involved in cellulose biosynthesis
VPTLDEVADQRIAPAWDELADAVGAPPFLRPGWFDAWRRAFGRGAPHVFTTSRGGAVTAVLPLQARAGRWRSPTNWHTPAFGVVAASTSDAETLAADLAAAPVHEVDLAFLRGDEAWTDVVAAAFASARHRTIRRVQERSPYVDTTGSWDDYVAARRGKWVRQLQRRAERLAERGEVTVDVADGTTGLDGLLAEGFAVEASGWKGDAGTAIATQPATRTFYTEVARWAAERGWLRLTFLRLDGRAIGFLLALDDGRVHYALKTGHDAGYRDVAAGNQLHWHCIRHAFASPAVRFDFLGRFDTWKTEWTSEAHDMVRLQAFRRSATGTAAWAAWTYGRPAAKRVLATARGNGHR